jgi:hypothetical protein
MKMEAAFNRRMRKTARTVVWEGAGAQSPAPDPITTLSLALNEPVRVDAQLPCAARPPTIQN